MMRFEWEIVESKQDVFILFILYLNVSLNIPHCVSRTTEANPRVEWNASFSVVWDPSLPRGSTHNGHVGCSSIGARRSRFNIDLFGVQQYLIRSAHIGDSWSQFEAGRSEDSTVASTNFRWTASRGRLWGKLSEWSRNRLIWVDIFPQLITNTIKPQLCTKPLQHST